LGTLRAWGLCALGRAFSLGLKKSYRDLACLRSGDKTVLGPSVDGARKLPSTASIIPLIITSHTSLILLKRIVLPA
jgi:hypothetical protein